MAFANEWLSADCGLSNDWCNQADFLHVGNVDMSNFSIMQKYWMDSSTTLPHNECLDAIPVQEGVPYVGSTVDATGSLVNACGGARDVWHSFTPNLSGPFGVYTVSLCGSSFDTVLSVLDACGGEQ